MKKIIALIIVVCLIVVGISSCTACTSFNDHTYTVKVTDKERIQNAKGSYYLIYGFDESGNSKVFKNTDTLLRGKFNSSNIYVEIEEDKTYNFTVVGHRIPFCSTYENIINYEEINDEVVVNEN